MKEALKLALEALETLHDENMDYLVRNKLGGENNQCMVFARDVIKSIKRTLAQPEEEKLHPVHIGVDVTKEGTAVTAFYRKPDAVMEMFYAQFHPMSQPEQEPVAWKETDEVECPVCKDKGFPWPKCGHITYLERTPPQRTWVGLTDEEIDQGLLRSNHALQTAGAWRDGVEWATKQLKEKNT